MDEFRSLALTCRSDGLTADQTAEALLFNGASPIDAIKALPPRVTARQPSTHPPEAVGVLSPVLGSGSSVGVGENTRLVS